MGVMMALGAAERAEWRTAGPTSAAGRAANGAIVGRSAAANAKESARVHMMIAERDVRARADDIRGNNAGRSHLEAPPDALADALLGQLPAPWTLLRSPKAQEPLSQVANLNLSYKSCSNLSPKLGGGTDPYPAGQPPSDRPCVGSHVGAVRWRCL